MEELLEREDFHRLVLEAHSPGTGSQVGLGSHQDPLPLLAVLEETLGERLCSLHPTCRK